MRHYLTLAALVAGLAFPPASSGCGGRTLGGYLPNPYADAGVQPDAALPLPEAGLPDAGPSACISDDVDVLVPKRTESVYVMQEGVAVYPGQTVRIAVSYLLEGCQRAAYVNVEVDEVSQAIWIVPYVWDLVGSSVVCPDVVSRFDDIITIENPSVGQWLVSETTSGIPPQTTSFVVLPCDPGADCFCGGGTPDPGWTGDDCQYNCDCDSELSCLRHSGFGGPFSICGRSCAADGDCYAWEECAFWDDGAWGVCFDASDRDRCPPGGCELGFVCVQGAGGGAWCQADFTLPFDAPTCSCNEECGVGLRCVDGGTAPPPYCATPCRGPADCPDSGLCGAVGLGNHPICLSLWM